MKKYAILIVLCFTFSFISSINHQGIAQEKPKVGDTLIVLKSKGENYKFIKFPKRNILIKRGALPSYESVINSEVVITKVLENKYGRIDVMLKRADGRKFFNKINSIKAIYQKAIDKGELKLKS